MEKVIEFGKALLVALVGLVMVGVVIWAVSTFGGNSRKSAYPAETVPTQADMDYVNSLDLH